MQVIRYPHDVRPTRWLSPVVALGNFDGVHRGHLKVIECIRQAADSRSAAAVALTFDPHPPRVVRPDKAPPLLMTLPQKITALERAGAHGVGIVPFTSVLSRLSPEAFVKDVLVDWMRVAEVWVGADFLFGRDREGTFSRLRSLGLEHGFRTEKIEPVRYKEFVVSSTRVRRLVAEGRVDEAGALLGHHYVLEGTVVSGARRGRQLGFPTANLSTENELVPAAGVYATMTEWGGVWRPSVSNVGVRPTVEAAGTLTIETHVLGLDADLYGARVSLAFVQRVRDERRFDGLDALREQIAADVREARRLFERITV